MITKRIALFASRGGDSMAQSCPISGEKRDENVARAVAFLVVAILTGVVMLRELPAAAILVALAADFTVRAFGKPRNSPLAAVARFTVRTLNIPPKLVDAAPKRFAARLGLGFSSISAVLFLLGLNVAAVSVTGILMFCATLEAAFAFCLGCRVYALLPHKR